MHWQREPAGGAFHPDAWRGESSNMRPDPLVMWLDFAETLTHTPLLSPLSLPPFPPAHSLTQPPSQTQSHRQRQQSRLQKKEQALLRSVHTQKGRFGLQQGHPLGKHMHLINTRLIRFTTIHVPKKKRKKSKASFTQLKLTRTFKHRLCLQQSHSNRMYDISVAVPWLQRLLPSLSSTKATTARLGTSNNVKVSSTMLTVYWRMSAPSSWIHRHTHTGR